ncbi:MAG: GNAT family N-acetyltransferase [Rhodobacter sp.]|nr:GNAT family N-acetyltransferase [Paracoccaceae bacterium]MCC0075497.1 GNAT family N-acetyltransferase [Rhodobacter sp.]
MSVTLSATPVLETERLILRAPVAADWAVWRGFMLSERSVHVRAAEVTEALAWRAFGHFIGHWVLRGWGNFVVTDRASGAALGACGPWFPAGWPERELGWSIWDAAAEGEGIAFEAAQAARGFAYDVLGWDTAVSYIAASNARSRALAGRLGCTLDAGAAHPEASGPVEVWRHPARDALVDGGMEAYA